MSPETSPYLESARSDSSRPNVNDTKPSDKLSSTYDSDDNGGTAGPNDATDTKPSDATDSADTDDDNDDSGDDDSDDDGASAA